MLQSLRKKKKIAEKNIKQEQKHLESKQKTQDEDLKENKIKNVIKQKQKEEMIIRTIEEDYRKGDFEKLFPLCQNVDKYQNYFAGLETENDRFLWKWLKNPSWLQLSKIEILHQNPV